MMDDGSFYNADKRFKKNISVKKCAVSDFNGYSKLYRSETGVNDSIVDKVSKKFDKVKVVEINSILKKIFSNFYLLDILKIDTEGYEFEVLIGAKDVLSKISIDY